MRTLLALFLFAAPLVAAPVPKALKKRPALDGVWQVVEWHSGNAQLQLTDEVLWKIDGETLAVEGKNTATPAGFVANANRTMKKPEGGADNAIDYTILPTDGSRPSFRPSVFEVDGDTFTICLTDTHNGPRPAECKPSGDTVTYVLKRVDAK